MYVVFIGNKPLASCLKVGVKPPVEYNGEEPEEKEPKLGTLADG